VVKTKIFRKGMVITVKFKNGKEWQKAHVAKIVKEKLEPYTGGVKFNFVNMQFPIYDSKNYGPVMHNKRWLRWPRWPW
jgi:hypothetical protein